VVRARVVAARERQARRFASDRVRTNAELTPARMARFCDMDGDGVRLLNAAASRLGLSARAYDRVRKVARTIADLDASDAIRGDHVGEALQFRMPWHG
jgi:magnesium chelatase family protein